MIRRACFGLTFRGIATIIRRFIVRFELTSFAMGSHECISFSSTKFFVPRSTSRGCGDRVTGLFNLCDRFYRTNMPGRSTEFLLPCYLFSGFFYDVGKHRFLRLLGTVLCNENDGCPRVMGLKHRLGRRTRGLAPNVVANFSRHDGGCVPSGPSLSFVNSIPHHAGNGGIRLLSCANSTRGGIREDTLVSCAGTSARSVSHVLSSSAITSGVACDLIRSSEPETLRTTSFALHFGSISLSKVARFAHREVRDVRVPRLVETSEGQRVIPRSIGGSPRLLLGCRATFGRGTTRCRELHALNGDRRDLICCLLDNGALSVIAAVGTHRLLAFVGLHAYSQTR